MTNIAYLGNNTFQFQQLQLLEYWSNISQNREVESSIYSLKLVFVVTQKVLPLFFFFLVSDTKVFPRTHFFMTNRNVTPFPNITDITREKLLSSPSAWISGETLKRRSQVRWSRSILRYSIKFVSSIWVLQYGPSYEVCPDIRLPCSENTRQAVDSLWGGWIALNIFTYQHKYLLVF